MKILKTATKEIHKLLADSSQLEYLGENVSQLTHALQCAHFAQKSNFTNEFILGALLHDIGHLISTKEIHKMKYLGNENHEELGAKYLLQKGLSPYICQLVRDHVRAKRYLVYKDQGHKNKLSKASLETLKYQGGEMDKKEAQGFEADTFFQDKILLRKCDESAKKTNLVVLGLKNYIGLINSHIY